MLENMNKLFKEHFGCKEIEADRMDKARECDRWAILINGYVEFVEDSRYCVVKK